MAPLLDWKHTAKPGFEQEEVIMADFGLVKNENIYGTDLLYPESDTYVEVKSIGSHKIAVVRAANGQWVPKYMFFQAKTLLTLTPGNYQPSLLL